MPDPNRHGSMSKRTNKFTYLHVVQGNYGYGWDDLTESEDYREARADLTCYRKNETQYSHRMIKRRELNAQA
jgi:inosine/xanthosine triphosphate pyrophosphatase family protein